MQASYTISVANKVAAGSHRRHQPKTLNKLDRRRRRDR